MICDICNTENEIDTVKCAECGVWLNTTDTPLSGNERARLLLFAIVAFLSPPFFPVVFILVVYAIYAMKVDKSFKPIINAKKNIFYFLIFAVIVYALIIVQGFVGKDRISSADFGGLIFIGIFGMVVIPLIYNFLFFDIMEKHRHFIVKNGIFANGSDAKVDDKVGILGREGISSFSIADELLKWNSLLEKGMITQKEFNSAKEKILEKR